MNSAVKSILFWVVMVVTGLLLYMVVRQSTSEKVAEYSFSVPSFSRWRSSIHTRMQSLQTLTGPLDGAVDVGHFERTDSDKSVLMDSNSGAESAPRQGKSAVHRTVPCEATTNP